MEKGIGTIKITVTGNLVADAKDEVIGWCRHLLYQNPELSIEEEASIVTLLANLAVSLAPRLSTAVGGARKCA